ncbi:nitrilotriacetate monooxygenase, partial [Mycobacterium sp. ITM-2017-0098]
LSGGRIAWNIVGSYSPSEFAAYGQKMPDRSIRYERIAEYVDLCCQLWDSWQPDAVVADRATGIYAHPEKIREVNFDGKHFRCRAR